MSLEADLRRLGRELDSGTWSDDAAAITYAEIPVPLEGDDILGIVLQPVIGGQFGW